jgi:hypothetical protein
MDYLMIFMPGTEVIVSKIAGDGMIDEFPIVKIHKSTYDKFEKAYKTSEHHWLIEKMVRAEPPGVAPYTTPRREIIFSASRGRILAYRKMRSHPPGEWFYFGCILTPVYDREGKYLGPIEHSAYRTDICGLKLLSTKPYEKHICKPADGDVLYEIVIVPDDVPEDVSKLQATI